MAQHRVQCDFDIEFLNGGSLQGRAFRLDIPGHEISDAALAAYVVRDLRLLMVGSVRVFHKQIIAEPHQRRATRRRPRLPSRSGPAPAL